jgi:ParB-like nuclease domain
VGRKDFQLLADVPVVDILLDQGNPRIRDGQDQADCISRILRKEDQLLALIQDIAKNGLTTAPILVKPKGDGRFVVMDGNRRMTALKLLNDPGLCPVERLKGRLRALQAEHSEGIPSTVDVFSSSNDEAIAREVLARHSGAQGGVGQLDWSAYLRTVFQLNHGHPPEYRRPGQYAMWAERHGIHVGDEFPITSLQRFFSVENLALLGFSIEEDELILDVSEDTAKRLAQIVITDFDTAAVRVDDVRRPDQARDYIARARARAGLLPASAPEPALTAESLAPTPPSDDGGTGAPASIEPRADTPPTDRDDASEPASPARPPPAPRQPPSERKRILGTAAPGFSVPEAEPKARTIVAELRKLDVRESPLATAMLLRALIEISDEHYRRTHRRTDLTKLAKNILASATHMRDSGTLTTGAFDMVSRLAQPGGADLLHVETLQKILHRDTHIPSYQVVNTFWDNIAPFVRACWAS